jgi:hypothetical protein
MKTTVKSKICLSVVMTALVSGCTVTVTPRGGEMVVAPPPPPAVVVAPEFYVWDGVEFVGEVNGAYMYLNPGGVWVVCDGPRLERFHGWERYHADWRRTAIRYDRAHRPDPRSMRREEERHDR